MFCVQSQTKTECLKPQTKVYIKMGSNGDKNKIQNECDFIFPLPLLGFTRVLMI